MFLGEVTGVDTDRRCVFVDSVDREGVPIQYDYLILAAGWDKNHPGDPPQLMGQLFHFFDAPNRFGLPAFYTLHVWAWKPSPTGTFVNWHANVSCDAFSGQNP